MRILDLGLVEHKKNGILTNKQINKRGQARTGERQKTHEIETNINDGAQFFSQLILRVAQFYVRMISFAYLFFFFRVCVCFWPGRP